MNDEKATKPEAVGDRLRWAREQCGLSQGQVSKMLGYHRPTISQIEAGKRKVNADEIAKFADIYSVKEGWIVKGDSEVESLDDPRIQLIARELNKLKREDLDSIAQLVKILKSNKEG